MAGVDQGIATLSLEMESRNFDILHLVGITVGLGIDTPSAATGLFETVPIDMPNLAGPRTNTNRPTLPARVAGTSQGTVDVADSDKVTPTLDWFEQVHVLPRTKIDFANIITQQTNTYEMYSAYRTQSITLSGIVNNALPGIDLPDESTPEVVPPQSSMLDSATTDNCSDTFALATMVLREIVAEATGLSVFDTSLDFTFSSGDTPQLFVSGSRIVLIPMEYESPVKETLEFLTDVVTALTGAEQRISVRKQPRQLFEVIYKLDENDRQRMQALLMDWSSNIFGFPLQQEQVRLTSAVSAGATQYPVSGVDDIDLRIGGLALAFTDVNVFDVITVDARTDTLITAEDVSLNSYPIGTKIMPLRTARIVGMQAGRRHPNNLEEFKIIFEVTDNDTGSLTGSTAAYSSHNGRVLFDDCNVLINTISEKFVRRVHRLDNKTGLVSTSTDWDRNKRNHQKGFVLRSRSETIDFRRLMLALRGKQKAFYIPTFIEDLEPVASLGSGTAVMDIRRIDYERFIKSRDPKIRFRITFTDGTSLFRIIQSVASVDATTERLTVDINWPATRTVAEIDRIEFLELSRFDSDNVIINHVRAGLARSRMPVMQVFDDN